MENDFLLISVPSTAPGTLLSPKQCSEICRDETEQLLHTLGAQAGLLPTQCLSPKLSSSQLSSAIHHANPQAQLAFGSFLHILVHVRHKTSWDLFCERVARGTQGYKTAGPSLKWLIWESVGGLQSLNIAKTWVTSAVFRPPTTGEGWMGSVPKGWVTPWEVSLRYWVSTE